jgi:hypothetical protein
MYNELITNLDKIHTTELGIERIKRNLDLDITEIVEWCKQAILTADTNSVTRRGKNWYVVGDGFILTINAASYTVITAHKKI